MAVPMRKKLHLLVSTIIIMILHNVFCRHQRVSPGDHLEEITNAAKRDTAMSDVEAILSRYNTISHGDGTYYGEYPGGGACSLDPLSPLSSQPGWIRVAAGRDDFRKSLGCGMCLEVQGSGRGKGSDPITGKLKAVVHDLCGGCSQGSLDLYIPGDGRWDISFKAVDCPTLPGKNGNIQFRFTGSDTWYIKLQARNTRIPAAGIEVLKKNGRYSCLRRVGDNYFVGDGLGQVTFPMRVRVTSVSGEQLEETILRLENDVNTPTTIQFSGFSSAGTSKSFKCFGQGNKFPYPSQGAKYGIGGSTEPETGEKPSGGTAGGGTEGGGSEMTTQKPESGAGAGSDFFCQGKPSGYYADPNDCRGFIICNIGKAHRMKCPSGQLFNDESYNCDLPQRVSCGTRPTQTT